MSELERTGVFASEGDFEKILFLARQGWQEGEVMICFSVGEGIKKDESTMEAKDVCHKLALQYGLPEIQGMYGINKDREFVKFRGQ